MKYAKTEFKAGFWPFAVRVEREHLYACSTSAETLSGPG